MSVRKDEKGNFIADVYDSNGKKMIRKFSKKTEADEFIAYHSNIKRDQKLVSSNVKKAKTSISSAIDEFALTKGNLRSKSIQKYNFVFITTNLIDKKQYVGEHTTDDL